MNEDYLWDKSGQPDPQIQELEEILGTLRYQPKPLVIPRELEPSRRRNYFPLLAAAATVLLALLAAGVWVQVRTSGEAQPQQAKLPPAPVVPEVVKPKSDPVQIDERVPIRETIVLANNKRRNRSAASALKQHEREEALAAKEQLMLALRVTSQKLSLAHRKTQSTTPANQIKNQHRIG